MPVLKLVLGRLKSCQVALAPCLLPSQMTGIQEPESPAGLHLQLSGSQVGTSDHPAMRDLHPGQFSLLCAHDTLFFVSFLRNNLQPWGGRSSSEYLELLGNNESPVVIVKEGARQ